MAGRGVHFSLDADEVGRLRAIADEEDRIAHVGEVIETTYFETYPERTVETDKSWDAMHRALTDGHLHWSGVYPLDHVVLGGERFTKSDDYVMVVKTPQQVKDCAALLPGITEEDFRRRYFAIDVDDYENDLAEDDFEYTWSNFVDLREFWLRAASEDRFVLFTVDP